MTTGEAVTALGYVAGGVAFWLAARRRGRATPGLGLVALAGLMGGLIGAKAVEWALSGRMPPLDPRAGGRTIIGGILCGWLAVEIAKWRLGIRRSTGDLFALALPAGEAVGRVGCHLNGCCYGLPTTARWAVYQHGAWRQPSQIVAAAVALAVFAALWSLRDRLPKEGDLFRAYLLLYGLGRFGVEFLRERPVAFAGLSMAQLVCLEIAASGALFLWLGRRDRPRKWAAEAGGTEEIS